MAAKPHPRLSAHHVALAYALFGVLYILLSDRLLIALAGNYEHYQALQTAKGWAFIGLTSLALWLVLRAVWRRLDQTLHEVLLAKDRMRMALDAAKGGTWQARIAADGSIRIQSDGYIAQALGLTGGLTRDLTGGSASLSTDLRRRIHPDDLAHFDAQIAAIGAGTAVSDLICRFRAPDARYLWLKVVADTASRDRDPEGALFGVAFDISDLQDTTQSLAEVIFGGELGTWRYDLATERINVNARWAEIIGYQLDELMPMSIADWRRLVHPEDMERRERTQASRFAAGDFAFSDEFRMRHKDGTWVWVQSRGRALEISPSGKPIVLSGVHIDISQRKSLEHALLAEHDLLQRLIETSVSGIMAVDETGMVVFANKEVQAIFGREEAGAVGTECNVDGLHLRAFDGTPLGPTELPYAQVLLAGRILRDQRIRFTRPDGSERVISVNAAPISTGTGTARAVCAITDITQRMADELRLAQSAEDAQYAALHDRMTGLPNRELFEEYLAAGIRAAAADASLLMQVFIDVDQFKQINDRFGHQWGDRLISQVAARLEALRSGAQVVARITGDEFTFLHPFRPGEETGGVIAAIEALFDTPFELLGQTVFLSVSLGVSIYPVDAASAEEIWQNSDLAMYEAKALGGNRCARFSSGLRNRFEREAMIGQGLQRALRDKSFALVLQPKVDLADPSRLVGAEALVRCLDPGLHGIGPAEFMPIAERTGLVRGIDLIVIDLVATLLAGLRAAGKALRVSVNLSPESLRQARFCYSLLDHLGQVGLGAADVLFELTEGTMLDHCAETRENIAALQAHGFELSADDFGTGYSSLGYLQQLRLQEIKIDRSFVSRLGLAEGSSDAIVRATLAMSHALGLRTVAEGIDTQAQAEWLRDHGCDLGQGYLFARPLSPEVFVQTYLRGPDLRGPDLRDAEAAVAPALPDASAQSA